MSENYIYMAGLVDGEGTIGISYMNNKFYRSPYVSLTSTTPEIMSWLKSTFGGHIVTQKVYKENHKPSWSWKLTNIDQTFDLLQSILPYMKEPDKRRRALLLLNEYKLVTSRNGKYTETARERKLDFESRFLSR